MNTETTRRRRLLAPKRGAAAAAAGALVGLATPGVAAAWGYLGPVGPSNHYGGCHWYTSLGVCGWNYWSWESGHVYKKDARLLVGFEDYSAIRGYYWVSSAGDFLASTSQLGFPYEYLAIQATYFAGPQSGSLYITS